MKKVGFIGALDKTDMVVYTGKILSLLGLKVLIVDSTLNQKARYIIPNIIPSRYYVTEYEKIDIAVGFDSLEKVEEYLDELNYDIVLIDIDSFENFDSFGLEQSDINFFVTAFDSYSLKKGLEIIGSFRENLKITRVLFEKEIRKEDEDYLKFISKEYPIDWDEEIIYFPLEQGDWTAIAENQKVTKIKFRNLTEEYRCGLETVATKILPDVRPSDIRKVIKSV